MSLLISWVVYALAILITAYLLPGVHVDDFVTALILSVVLGVLNVFLKPVLKILTLPINILSLGLFSLVINAILILLAARVVEGFSVDNFWWALLFGIILSIINSMLSSLMKVVR